MRYDDPGSPDRFDEAPDGPSPGPTRPLVTSAPAPPDPPVPTIGGYPSEPPLSPWDAPPVSRPSPTERPIEVPPTSWPAWAPEPEPEPRPEERSGNRRSLLLAALLGAVVAAIVATLVTLAVDDGRDGGAAAPAPPITVEGGQLDIQGILAKVQPSVVALETSQATVSGVFEGAGTGIILSEDGLVLTNAHVIGGLGDVTAVLFDGSRRSATLVGSFPEDDLALVQLDGAADLVPAELGSSDALRVGDEVIAIGNALNLGSQPTVTRGIVSAKDRSLEAQGVELNGLIQTDAAINPGNSGGPLVDAAGRIVGVNTAILREAQNLGFAIAIDRAKPLIEDLKAGGGDITPDTAFLGISSNDVSELTPTVRERFGIEDDAGAFVTEVVPDSGADEAGIEPGDVIVGFDDRTIGGSSDVQEAVRAAAPGDEVELRLLREGEEVTLRATLGRRG
jgi:serine protease Do